MPRCGGQTPAFAGVTGKGEMTPERKKEFKVYAIAAVIILAIVVFRFGLREAHQRALDAGDNGCAVPSAPPWGNESARIGYLDGLKEKINREFPKGTDVDAFEKTMKAACYNVVDEGSEREGHRPEKKILFNKKLYDHSCGESWGGFAEYDDQGKISTITITGGPLFCR
jgi:hypothetical protein